MNSNSEDFLSASYEHSPVVGAHHLASLSNQLEEFEHGYLRSLSHCKSFSTNSLISLSGKQLSSPLFVNESTFPSLQPPKHFRSHTVSNSRTHSTTNLYSDMILGSPSSNIVMPSLPIVTTRNRNGSTGGNPFYKPPKLLRELSSTSISSESANPPIAELSSVPFPSPNSMLSKESPELRFKRQLKSRKVRKVSSASFSSISSFDFDCFNLSPDEQLKEAENITEDTESEEVDEFELKGF